MPSEAEFQRTVIQLAELRGWMVYHTLDSRGSDVGFPDLVLLRGPRIIYAELKRSSKERLRPEQEVWADRLGRANQAVFLWHPDLWGEIVSILN